MHFLSFINLKGLCYSQGLSAVLDLKHIFNVELASINISNIFNNIGYFFGSLCGLFYTLINRQLTVAVMLLLMGIAKAVTILLPNVSYLYIDMFIIGMAQGVMDCSISVWLLEMWSGKWANFIMQIYN